LASVILGTVTHRSAAHIPTLNRTERSASFGSSRNVNIIAFREHVSRNHLANFVLRQIYIAEFFNVALRSGASLLNVAERRFRCVLFFLFVEAELDCSVAVIV